MSKIYLKKSLFTLNCTGIEFYFRKFFAYIFQNFWLFIFSKHDLLQLIDFIFSKM
jgi:hypothetical protein